MHLAKQLNLPGGSNNPQNNANANANDGPRYSPRKKAGVYGCKSTLELSLAAPAPAPGPVPMPMPGFAPQGNGRRQQRTNDLLHASPVKQLPHPFPGFSPVKNYHYGGRVGRGPRHLPAAVAAGLASPAPGIPPINMENIINPPACKDPFAPVPLVPLTAPRKAAPGFVRPKIIQPSFKPRGRRMNPALVGRVAREARRRAIAGGVNEASVNDKWDPAGHLAINPNGWVAQQKQKIDGIQLKVEREQVEFQAEGSGSNSPKNIPVPVGDDLWMKAKTPAHGPERHIRRLVGLRRRPSAEVFWQDYKRVFDVNLPIASGEDIAPIGEGKKADDAVGWLVMRRMGALRGTIERAAQRAEQGGRR